MKASEPCLLEFWYIERGLFRAVIKDRDTNSNIFHGWVCLFDGPLMLRVDLPDVDTICPENDKLITGAKINETGRSKLNDSLVWIRPLQEAK